MHISYFMADCSPISTSMRTHVGQALPDVGLRVWTSTSGNDASLRRARQRFASRGDRLSTERRLPRGERRAQPVECGSAANGDSDGNFSSSRYAGPHRNAHHHCDKHAHRVALSHERQHSGRRDAHPHRDSLHFGHCHSFGHHDSQSFAHSHSHNKCHPDMHSHPNDANGSSHARRSPLCPAAFRG